MNISLLTEAPSNTPPDLPGGWDNAQLSQMSQQLKETSAQIETSVLEVCRAFQGIAEQATAAVDRGQSFLNQPGVEGGGRRNFDSLICQCSETLLQALKLSQESGDVSRRAILRIQQMDAASRKIATALEQLKQIGSGNQILALNARIEAARAGELGAGFGVVAVEVASQSAKSREVTSHMSDLIDELRSLAACTVEDLEQRIAQDVVSVEECRRKVDCSLEELRSTHGAMKNVLDGMSSDGKDLAREINVATRGMQFQDRISQRIAHVVEALDLLHNRMSITSRDGSGMDDLEVKGYEFSNKYTMREERLIAGIAETEAAAGDVELF